MSTTIDGIPTPELINRDILDIGEPDEEFFRAHEAEDTVFFDAPRRAFHLINQLRSYSVD
ncbi:hypothetical protein [Staphylococcus aureus]|uniref:hypothetical protein n=1 Tax=Staphylococcus aureus TaxID=1280 RepID=UPI001C2EF78B|nr:hypothetical protein [Staphylococcus aureus]